MLSPPHSVEALRCNPLYSAATRPLGYNPSYLVRWFQSALAIPSRQLCDCFPFVTFLESALIDRNERNLPCVLQYLLCLVFWFLVVRNKPPPKVPRLPVRSIAQASH